ncbi:hypothetical protein B0H16DRAFT_1891611 [Mycena metata]|uniref:Uncharacterized protein n=1 Tax=Mycena metata TaxID=1033252 RepID=A0AAD7I8J1_9AGAR|nr:hypothetical protein B0H16DRAFT_1891611 [Mycena metata]
MAHPIPRDLEDDDDGARIFYSPGSVPVAPVGLVPPLRRALFAQDWLHEEDAIRPIYAHTMEPLGEYTPPASPLPSRLRDSRVSPADITFPLRESPLTPTSSTVAGSDDSPPTAAAIRPVSPAGLIRFSHFTLGPPLTYAMEEISCEYCPSQNLFLQYIQFSLGGVPNPEQAGTISPRAVFRTWAETDQAETEPFWVKYSRNHGYSLRPVLYEFAVGRAVLLAHLRENLSISNQLVQWAEKFHPTPFDLEPANLRYISDRAAEDESED